MDIFTFPWISREDMGNIVHKIGNRQFAEFLQEYLHKWGKQTLKCVNLIKDGLHPQTPIPENIGFFEYIQIRHFDANSLDFLRQLQPIFHGVNLQMYIFPRRPGTANLHQTILPHLAPLLRSIHSLSITIDRNAIPLVEQQFAQQLGQLKKLSLDFDRKIIRSDQTTIQTAINFGMDWLQRGRTDEPKLLELELDKGLEIFQQFCTAIKQQFLLAKTPQTFAVQFWLIENWQHIPSFHMENAIGEQLHGKEVETCTFQINRHPVNAGNGLQEWVEKTVEKTSKSCIDISPEMSIGQIEAVAGEVNDGENEDGPSISKKPKLGA